MVLSVHQAEHAGNVEQKCRWTRAAQSKSFHVSSSPSLCPLIPLSFSSSSA